MFDEQLVDLQAGEEFAREVLSRLPLDQTDKLLAELEAKSRGLQRVLSERELLSMDGVAACRVLRRSAGVRRRAEELLQAVGVDELRSSWAELLYGSGSVEQRVTSFCRRLGSRWNEGEVIDLAGEALHYVFPGQYWLWTRWVWNPRTQSGALRLVVPDWRMLGAATPGEVYRRVGEAVAYAEAARESMGLFSQVKRRDSPFLNDIYLVVVYTLYLFTVLRMRMTKEFTRLLPPPWELIRKLLGVSSGEGFDAEARA